MQKALPLLFLFVSLLFAAPNKIEIFAGSMQSQNGIVTLKDDIVVLYGEYILVAKEAKYNKNREILELFGGVKISSKEKYKILGNYAKLNLKDKKRIFEPFYMLDMRSKVWLNGDKGCDEKGYINISKGVISGCNPKDPLWQIEFSSSDYNKKTKWLNLYNTVLYIYDIPVLYTPYFGYSLDTTRRTGLLTPSFGYSSNEGIYFEQPFYIAEQNWWDMEFKPQIRTNRGRGIYGSFRFVDSKYSKGKLNFGYFKEKDTYFQENNLANQKHYGVDFHYTNTNVFKSFFDFNTDTQSVLYIDTTNMNDVDYINLATNDSSKNITSSQTISRANLFFNSDKNYLATYLKYYVDLNKASNANTIQQLPSLQYHRYLDTLLQDHLLYNFDIKSTYLYRKEGTTAIQTDLSIPIKLQTSLFNEYLNISLDAYNYAQYSKFQNDPTISSKNFQNGYYLRNYDQLSLSTQLTKPYSNFVHTIGFSSSYIKKGGEQSSGFYKENKDIDCKDPNNSEECSFYKLSGVQEALMVDFNQYLFNSKGKEILYHRLSDIITDPGKGNSSVGELESELNLALTDHISYYNDSLYNFTYHLFSKQFNKISFNGYGLNIALSHFYKKNFTSSTKTSYATSSIQYRYNNHYSYKAIYDYDLELKVKKRAEVGFLYQKRCWNFGLRYAENNRPILTKDQKASSVYDRYIYFTIVLKPIMKPTASDFFGLRLPKTLRN
ncbi:Outer membrane protein Imp, required for envelope biogenesis / Organic solvent tolerance protein precursor [hydrothermal vent metagenome]|uniref:Outer membrane protein Imp, required for envelope biogenesis / Organic solvent tolerance protein n=1 Tax=hydrothermal vent metagenome TaxID=652676 RepID=A0A1W1BWR6_9ZZZZ